tara:strand:+ start:2013 stop:3983 length:1971 start_codon:yes stop_codon:yes gene_type:complete
MKWLGQYVQSFTARFRSDVYLEDISSGTIVSGGHLGLDSNDKIVKAVDGGGDLTSIVAGAGMTGTSLTGPIPTLNVIGGDGMTANANNVAVRAAQTTITSIYNAGLKVGNSSTDSLIAFNDDGKISFVTAGDEQIALQDGVLAPRVNNDVDLGKEDFRWKDIYAQGTVHSATGFSGNLTGNASGSSGTVTSIGNLTGEVTSTNRATVIAGDVVDEANLKCSNGPTNGHFLSAQSGNTGGLTWAAIPTLNQNTTGQAGTVATIAGLAPNTAPTGTFVLPATAASQANITTLTGLATVGTTGATFNIQSDNIISINTTSNKPEFSLLNLTDDASASVITFVKQRIITSAPYIGAGLDNDVIGTIDFQGKGDNLSEDTDFARIYADIHDASDATISGRLNLQVEAHGGGLESGLVLTGGSQDDEVDVTVGLGADSVVTIPGNIDLAGDIDVDGTLEVDAFKGTGSTTVTNILDEDAMGSNSATALATQQSIKAYADTKRPNLYWFGVCDAATAGANDSLGAFPSTDVAIVSFANTTLTNDTNVFTLATDEVTITRAGVYKFTYNVLLEVSTGSNRTEGAIGILKNDGSSVTLVEGSRSSTYNRFAAGGVSRTAGSVSMFIDVAVDDKFYIGFYKEEHQTSNTILRTVPSGTTWTIEAVT